MASDSQNDLVQNMLDRVQEIKTTYPVLSGEVDAVEDELRSLMSSIKVELNEIDKERDRKLMTVYLINVVHKAIDEIMAD